MLQPLLSLMNLYNLLVTTSTEFIQKQRTNVAGGKSACDTIDDWQAASLI